MKKNSKRRNRYHNNINNITQSSLHEMYILKQKNHFSSYGWIVCGVSEKKERAKRIEVDSISRHDDQQTREINGVMLNS